jgi:nicotinate phosphoribosyltransferase
MVGDILSLEDDDQPGEPLVKQVMKGGRRLEPKPSLEALRERVRDELARLPHPLRRLGTSPAYPVEVAGALRKLAEETDRRLARQQEKGS